MGAKVGSRSVAGRLALFAILVLTVMWVPVVTQVPGQNVNMISVDRYLQKQNEVEVTISPLNPCHIVAAANDYRTVDNEQLNDGEIGDSWIGVYVSTDCGETWLNYIMPGYRNPYTTAADPVAKFGPGGAFYLGHIQFNRGTNWGKVSIARYLDYNNVEGVPASPKATDDESDPYASPLGFLGFVDIAKGAAGQFIDKPSIAVAPGKGKACKVTGGTIPSTNVYMAWAEFLSNSVEVSRSKVYVARSADCGNSLDGAPVKLSEGYPLSQGTAIAVHPSDPNLVYVAWRQIGVRQVPRRHHGGEVHRRRQVLHEGTGRHQPRLPAVRPADDQHHVQDDCLSGDGHRRAGPVVLGLRRPGRPVETRNRSERRPVERRRRRTGHRPHPADQFD